MLNPLRACPIISFATLLLATLFSNSQTYASGMYQITDLGLVTAGYGTPIINASGEVVSDPSGASLMKAGSYSISNGQSQTPGNNVVTCLAQNGSVIATLNTLLGNPEYNQISGYAVNKSGMVVGAEQNGQLIGGGIAFYYTPSGGMHAVPQVYSASNAVNAALSVNDSGMIVGTATGPNGYSNDQLPKAFISNGQTSLDLNSLIPSTSGWTLTRATFISDSGSIAGYGFDAKNQEHIFLLTPTATPEPSVLLILGAGIIAIGVRKGSRVTRQGARVSP